MRTRLQLHTLLLAFICLLGLTALPIGLRAQQVNMDRYITLTVKQGAEITLDFAAEADNTPVRVVSGSTDKTISVGTEFIGEQKYAAGATTMTVYGNVMGMSCFSNHANITALDVSNNQGLVGLFCDYNQLISLDVSRNAALYVLSCSGNRLTSLDVSKNPNLGELYCDGNQFTTQAWDKIFCALPSRTQAAEAAKIIALDNDSDPSKGAVLAANGSNATSKKWDVLYYNNNNPTPITGFKGTYKCGDPFGVDMDRYITLTVKQGADITLDFAAEADNTLVRIVSGSTDRTISVGTEFFGEQKYAAGATTMTVYGNVNKLDCSSNGENLTALDVSSNPALTRLSCSSNSLTTLDVSHNPALTRLSCSSNSLTTLDVSHNPALTRLSCGSNSITSLDVSSNPALTRLDCQGNELVALDVRSNPALRELLCRVNQLTGLDVSENPNLVALFCSDNSLTSLDVSSNPALTRLECEGNELTALDVSNNPALPELTCYNNKLTALDVSKCPALVGLHCFSNRLTSLDVSNNPALKFLHCYRNQLKSLDVSHNPALETLGCMENQLEKLDLSHNPSLKRLGCEINKLTALDVSNNLNLCELSCYANPLPIQAWDRLFCSLIDNPTTSEKQRIFPLKNGSDPQKNAVLAANGGNATSKKWLILYEDSGDPITGFTGKYACNSIPSVNMDHYITFTVKPGTKIRLSFMNESKSTYLRVISGSTDTLVAADTNAREGSYLASASTMTVYGDLDVFDCALNIENLTALDVSHNPDLKVLFCVSNSLIALDVSKNTSLIALYCFDNPLTTQALDELFCSLFDRSTFSEPAQLCLLESLSDSNKDLVLAANGSNAKKKNWQTLSFNNGDPSPITGFTGKYVCGGGSMGISQEQLEPLDVRPNPTHDGLYLVAEGIVRVYSVEGHLVLSAMAKGETYLDLSGLPDGVYIVRTGDRVARVVKK